MANWILIPLIPTLLSLRAYGQLQTLSVNRNLDQNHLLPFFCMVEFANDHPELPHTSIPCPSQIEQIGIHRALIRDFATNGIGAQAFAALWLTIVTRTVLAPVAGERAKDG